MMDLHMTLTFLIFSTSWNTAADFVEWFENSNYWVDVSEILDDPSINALYKENFGYYRPFSKYHVCQKLTISNWILLRSGIPDLIRCRWRRNMPSFEADIDSRGTTAIMVLGVPTLHINGLRCLFSERRKVPSRIHHSARRPQESIEVSYFITCSGCGSREKRAKYKSVTFLCYRSITLAFNSFILLPTARAPHSTDMSGKESIVIGQEFRAIDEMNDLDDPRWSRLW